MNEKTPKLFADIVNSARKSLKTIESLKCKREVLIKEKSKFQTKISNESFLQITFQIHELNLKISNLTIAKEYLQFLLEFQMLRYCFNIPKT